MSLAAEMISATDWLASIPPDLVSDIADNPIAPILTRFRILVENSLNTSASPFATPSKGSGVPDLGSLQDILCLTVDGLHSNSPLSLLLKDIALTPLASRWKYDMTRGAQPTLSSDICAFLGTLLAGRLQIGTRQQGSCLSLLRAAHEADTVGAWRSVFEILIPLPPSTTSSEVGLITEAVTFQPSCANNVVPENPMKGNSARVESQPETAVGPSTKSGSSLQVLVQPKSSTDSIDRAPPSTSAPNKRHASDQPHAYAGTKRHKASHPSITPASELTRIHTRLLSIKGLPIYTFTSPLQLIQALHDAIIGHRSLYNYGVLHGNISINNIMIPPPSHPFTDNLKGHLIGLGQTPETTRTSPTATPHRAGTNEFMAIGALEGMPHTYRHDLESFYYVFIWICIHYTLTDGVAAPCAVRKPALEGWTSDSNALAAAIKFGSISTGNTSGTQGLERIVDSFEDWARGLKELAREWKGVLFPVREGLVWTGTDDDQAPLYHDVLDILRRAVREME